MIDLLRDRLQSSLGGAYTLERELGGGGMSRVFVARDEALGRRVVVKVLTPELAQGLSAERFAREIKLAAALQEPHIVPVLSAGATADGLPYYTMPYVQGESLRHRLASGPLPLDEAVGILADVARALAYAHRQGIVHRDVKPENVLLHEGTAVVTDFGIARALSAARGERARDLSAGALTAVGTSLGTPAYMAPEQAAGDAADHRADLYAWGMMAYELLAGAHPFADKRTAQQLIAAQIAESPPPLGATGRRVPPPLAAAVMRCLNKDPERRFAHAGDLIAALEAARRGGGAGGGAVRRLPLVAAGAVLLLTAAGGGVVVAARERAHLGASRGAARHPTPGGRRAVRGGGSARGARGPRPAGRLGTRRTVAEDHGAGERRSHAGRRTGVRARLRRHRGGVAGARRSARA